MSMTWVCMQQPACHSKYDMMFNEFVNFSEHLKPSGKYEFYMYMYTHSIYLMISIYLKYNFKQSKDKNQTLQIGFLSGLRNNIEIKQRRLFA